MLGVERAETGKLDAVIAFDRTNDGIDRSVDGVARLSAGQAGLFADGFGEV